MRKGHFRITPCFALCAICFSLRKVIKKTSFAWYRRFVEIDFEERGVKNLAVETLCIIKYLYLIIQKQISDKREKRNSENIKLQKAQAEAQKKAEKNQQKALNDLQAYKEHELYEQK